MTTHPQLAQLADWAYAVGTAGAATLVSQSLGDNETAVALAVIHLVASLVVAWSRRGTPARQHRQPARTRRKPARPIPGEQKASPPQV